MQVGPIPDDGADGNPLARHADAGPVDGDPADGERERRVDKVLGVADVCARHRRQRRQLSQTEHHADNQATHYCVTLLGWSRGVVSS